jgi:hypothetical protein
MQIIDNINLLLGDDLKVQLTRHSKLKIAAACFSIYAYEPLSTKEAECLVDAIQDPQAWKALDVLNDNHANVIQPQATIPPDLSP